MSKVGKRSDSQVVFIPVDKISVNFNAILEKCGFKESYPGFDEIIWYSWDLHLLGFEVTMRPGKEFKLENTNPKHIKKITRIIDGAERKKFEEEIWNTEFELAN